MTPRYARYGLVMLATLAAACSSEANAPAPHPSTTTAPVPHPTTTAALLGQECHDAQGYVYRAERCP